MAKAKRALAGLPWVDQDTVAVNIGDQTVKFNARKVEEFDETSLLESFRKVGYPETSVTTRPKI